MGGYLRLRSAAEAVRQRVAATVHRASVISSSPTCSSTTVWTSPHPRAETRFSSSLLRAGVRGAGKHSRAFSSRKQKPWDNPTFPGAPAHIKRLRSAASVLVESSVLRQHHPQRDHPHVFWFRTIGNWKTTSRPGDAGDSGETPGTPRAAVNHLMSTRHSAPELGGEVWLVLETPLDLSSDDAAIRALNFITEARVEAMLLGFDLLVQPRLDSVQGSPEELQLDPKKEMWLSFRARLRELFTVQEELPSRSALENGVRPPLLPLYLTQDYPGARFLSHELYPNSRSSALQRQKKQKQKMKKNQLTPNQLRQMWQARLQDDLRYSRLPFSPATAKRILLDPPETEDGDGDVPQIPSLLQRPELSPGQLQTLREERSEFAAHRVRTLDWLRTHLPTPEQALPHLDTVSPEGVRDPPPDPELLPLNEGLLHLVPTPSHQGEDGTPGAAKSSTLGAPLKFLDLLARSSAEIDVQTIPDPETAAEDPFSGHLYGSREERRSRLEEERLMLQIHNHLSDRGLLQMDPKIRSPKSEESSGSAEGAGLRQHEDPLWTPNTEFLEAEKAGLLADTARSAAETAAQLRAGILSEEHGSAVSFWSRTSQSPEAEEEAAAMDGLLRSSFSAGEEAAGQQHRNELWFRFHSLPQTREFLVTWGRARDLQAYRPESPYLPKPSVAELTALYHSLLREEIAIQRSVNLGSSSSSSDRERDDRPVDVSAGEVDHGLFHRWERQKQTSQNGGRRQRNLFDPPRTFDPESFVQTVWNPRYRMLQESRLGAVWLNPAAFRQESIRSFTTCTRISTTTAAASSHSSSRGRMWSSTVGGARRFSSSSFSSSSTGDTGGDAPLGLDLETLESLDLDNMTDADLEAFLRDSVEASRLSLEALDPGAQADTAQTLALIEAELNRLEQYKQEGDVPMTAAELEEYRQQVRGQFSHIDASRQEEGLEEAAGEEDRRPQQTPPTSVSGPEEQGEAVEELDASSSSEEYETYTWEELEQIEDWDQFTKDYLEAAAAHRPEAPAPTEITFEVPLDEDGNLPPEVLRSLESGGVHIPQLDSVPDDQTGQAASEPENPVQSALNRFMRQHETDPKSDGGDGTRVFGVSIHDGETFQSTDAQITDNAPRMPSWVPEEKIREALEKAEAEDSTGYIYDVFQKLKKAKEQNRGLRKYVTPKKKNKKRRR